MPAVEVPEQQCNLHAHLEPTLLVRDPVNFFVLFQKAYSTIGKRFLHNDSAVACFDKTGPRDLLGLGGDSIYVLKQSNNPS